MKTNSILSQLFYAFNAFGIMMGLIFPLFAQFFVEWKDGMYIWFSVACFVAGLAIGFANYYIMKVVLLRKLQTFSNTANQIGKKDLSARCKLKSDDFIGQLAINFNTMTSSLAQSMETITTLSHKVAATSELVLADSENSFKLVHEQKQKIDNVTSAIDLISESSNVVSIQSSEASTLGIDTILLSQNTNTKISETVEKVDSLAKNIAAAQITISELAKDCDNIGSVLSVIKSIAEQTNLLALNAAIEAARAGESGRGFAVVADEVRTLAIRTQDSTSEIEQIILRLQTSSSKAVEMIKSSQNISEEATQYARDTGHSVSKMQHSIEAINNLSDDMNNNIKHQLGDVNSIQKLITEIRGQAESIDETAGNNQQHSDELNKTSFEMDSIVSSFKY